MVFYEMVDNDNSGIFSKRFDTFSEKWGQKCPRCGLGAGMRVPPVHLRIVGTPLPDIMTVPPGQPVVKNQVKEAMESFGLSGIRYLQSNVDIRLHEPVEGTNDLYFDEHEKRPFLVYVSPEEIQTGAPLDGLPFWSLDIRGHAWLRPENNCVPARQCKICGQAEYSTWDGGMLVDEGRWDGSDVFRLHEHPGLVIVTERVKALFEEHRFTGVEFSPLDEKIDKFARYRPPRPQA